MANTKLFEKMAEKFLTDAQVEAMAKDPLAVFGVLRCWVDILESKAKFKAQIAKVEAAAGKMTPPAGVGTEGVQRTIAQLALAAECGEAEFTTIAALAVQALDKLAKPCTATGA